MYSTVFDVGRNGFHWWICLFPMFFVLAGGLLWAAGQVPWPGQEERARIQKVFGLIGIVVGILATVSWLCRDYIEYRGFVATLTDPRCLVEEGTVRDFKPMPRGGHSTESFTVNGKGFSYGAGWGSTAFNSEWNKGLIKEGSQVKIWYAGANILRIQVRQ